MRKGDREGDGEKERHGWEELEYWRGWGEGEGRKRECTENSSRFYSTEGSHVK